MADVTWAVPGQEYSRSSSSGQAGTGTLYDSGRNLGHRRVSKISPFIQAPNGQLPPHVAMEQMNAQATDLRFLAQATVPLPADPAASVSAYETPRTQASPGSASVGDNSAPAPTNAVTVTPGPGVADSNSSKRKSADDGGSAAKQTRSKRNRVSLLFLCFSASAPSCAS